MEQLLCHLVGDFLIQNDWMASNKSKRSFPCLIHAITYTGVFLFITTSWKALLVIGITHFLIDRFHTPLKRLIWLKNHLNPSLSYPPFKECDVTGTYDDGKEHTKEIIKKYGKPRLFCITAWVYIVIDNLLHLLINYSALLLL